MKWTKFTLKTTTEAVDLISSMLDELGIEGIEIEDNVPLSEADTKGMFIDILPELPPDDGTAKVSFYLEDLSNLEDLLRNIEEGLDDLSEFVNVGERTIAVSETEDKDWINNWKQYFKPFTVDDILIKPTWEEIPAEHADKLLIEIDPALHPSARQIHQGRREGSRCRNRKRNPWNRSSEARRKRGIWNRS